MTPQTAENINRLVIASPQGRSGKTTITLGLLRAFKNKGYTIRPFKKGPDYIDPSWLSAAAGMCCHNLDSYLMHQEQICRLLSQKAYSCDLSIIEGAMGLFDGLDLAGSSSTAEIAKITNTQVILVLDATRMTRSAAAMVMGCQHFDPQVKICGVILNKVARPRHEKMLREAVEHFCQVPVLGAIPKDASLIIPDRHLGLVTQMETKESESLLDNLADVVARHVELDKIYAFSAQSGKLPIQTVTEPVSLLKNRTTSRLKIGVIRDEVFSFYYPENLEALLKAGAELKGINSLKDPFLPPDIDALYIGGGFPEVFAAGLEKNSSLRRSIKAAVESNLPVYAECGGLMYLARSLFTGERSYEMAGVLPLDIIMGAKPQAHGYTLLETLPGNPLFSSGYKVRGHEFHNSKIINFDSRNIKYAYKVLRGNGIDGKYDGIIYKGIFASYNHLHALGTPEWAEGIVCRANSFNSFKQSIKLEIPITS